MEKPKIRRHYQALHPQHLEALRTYVATHGITRTERQLELGVNGLKNALRGRGIYPQTLAKIVSLVTAAPKPPAATPPSRPSKVTPELKEIGAAASLVLEVLANVEPANRARVLDMARAAL